MDKSLSLPYRIAKKFKWPLISLPRGFFSIFLGSIPLVWQLLFFYLPLALLIFGSLVHNPAGSWNFSFSHYQQILTPTYLKIALRSLALAFNSSFICLVIAIPLAYCMAFTFRTYRNVLLFLLMIPFWTNFLLHVCAWTFVLEQDGFLNQLLLALRLIEEPLVMLNSSFAIMVMMVYYYLPFMVLPIYSSFERFDIRLLEASMNLGASWFKTLFKILFPLSMPAIRSGIFLVFIPAFGEFVIPELMGGDRSLFVGSAIATLISGPKTMALATAFTTLGIILLIIASALLQLLLKLTYRFLVRGVQ